MLHLVQITSCNFLILTLILDVNECEEGIHNCAQICMDTVGSYECDCNVGFEIDADQRTCKLSMFTFQNTTMYCLSSDVSSYTLRYSLSY